MITPILAAETMEAAMTSDVIRIGSIEVRYLVDGAAKGGLGLLTREATATPAHGEPRPHRRSIELEKL